MKRRSLLLSLSLAAVILVTLGRFRFPTLPTHRQSVDARSFDVTNTEASSPPMKSLPASPKPPDLRERYCLDAYKTSCETPWPSRDPTGKVRADVSGEIRALRRMRKIIQDNPSWASEQVQEALAKLIYTPARRKRAERAYAWVQKSLRSLITRQPETVFSAEEKKAVLDRLSRIRLELPPPASVYSDAADLVTKNTVYYERTPQDVLRLRIGGAYLLNTTSWYNVVYTFAHELAHSIDPCEAQDAGILPRAYGKLISCFVQVGWVPQDRSKCEPNEQVSEVFADWIAAQVVAQAISETGVDYSSDDRVRSAINATRDLCEQPSSVDSLDLSSHPRPETRIRGIMGSSPAIRRALSCAPLPPAFKYCSLQALATDRPSSQEKSK